MISYVPRGRFCWRLGSPAGAAAAASRGMSLPPPPPGGARPAFDPAAFAAARGEIVLPALTAWARSVSARRLRRPA